MKDYDDKLRIKKGVKKLFDAIRLTSEKDAKRIAKQMCTVCDGRADKFEDALSRKEYSISGMCQTCQNIVFQEDGIFGDDLD